MASAKKAPATKSTAKAKAVPASKKAAAPAKAVAKTVHAPKAGAKTAAPATHVKASRSAAASSKASVSHAAAKPALTQAKAAAAPKPVKKAPAATPKSPAPRAAAARPAPPAPAPAPAPVAESAKKAAQAKPGVNGATFALPPVKGTTKDGIAYTKDFDAKFLTQMRDLLITERNSLTGQATLLEEEAHSLIEEQEMGDVQFDDEGGEGDTMVVERERDLALSAQARQMIADIDAALERLTNGTYGYSIESGLPISRERLEAIPWATVLVSEKVGGIGKR